MKKRILALIVTSLMGIDDGVLLSPAWSQPREPNTFTQQSPIQLSQWLNQLETKLKTKTIDVSDVFFNDAAQATETAGGTVVSVNFAENDNKLSLTRSTTQVTAQNQAYLLGFNEDSASNLVTYVDLPKTGGPKLLLTPLLYKASIVVTEYGGGYRVYRDGRVNASALYDDVVMALDKRDYQGASQEGLVATTLLVFKDNQWSIIAQPQHLLRNKKNLFASKSSRRFAKSGEVVVKKFIGKSDSHFDALIKKERKQAQERLLDNAKALKINIESKISDGVLSAGDTLDVSKNTALSAWNDLREKVMAAADKELAPLYQQREELIQRLTSSTDKTLVNQLKALDITLDYYQQNFVDGVNKTLIADRLWLLKSQKNSHRMDSVVMPEPKLQARGKDKRTKAELYEAFKAKKSSYDDLIGSRKESYQKGVTASDAGNIPGYKFDMDSIDMMKMFLDTESTLTIEQRGMLETLISRQMIKEGRVDALNLSLRVNNKIEAKGGTVRLNVPQSFILETEQSGVCLPLARLLSVALDQQGDRGVELFGDKVFDLLSDGQSRRATLGLISSLHSNTQAKTAETSMGTMSINQIATTLEGVDIATGNQSFLMNSPFHSMLTGVINTNGQKKYFFYDPNFSIYYFDTPQKFKAALVEYFVALKFGNVYAALGSAAEDPKFDVLRLDAKKMAEIDNNPFHMKIKDFLANGIKKSDHEALLATGAETNTLAENAAKFDTDLNLQSSLNLLDSINITDDFYQAMEKLYKDNGWASSSQESRVPLLESIKQKPNGSYAIEFVVSNQDKLIEVNSSDQRIWRFKQYYDNAITKLKNSFNFKEGEVPSIKHNLTEAEGINGLNAAFAVQSIVTWLNEKQRNSLKDNTMPLNLTKALEIHGYVNLLQIAHGTVEDIAKSVGLYKSLMRNGQMINRSTLSTVGSIASEGIGLGLGIGSMVLDSYELANAQNDVQRAVFGTQLAFDSASTVTGLAGIGAGALGAGTASATLGGAGVILGGLAVGFTGLAQAFGIVAEDAKNVGLYFNDLKNAYQTPYDVEDEFRQVGQYDRYLVFKSGAVIKKIDLKQHQVILGSQFLYQSKHGKTGSGVSNYFFWASDFPQIDENKATAINVREKLGWPSQVSFPYSEGILVLPATPTSYISYSYQNLPGATTKKELGYDLLRKLESNTKEQCFDFDFYIFPSEYIIRTLKQDYQATQIEVVLDNKNRQIVMRPLDKLLSGKLTYNLIGDGASYQIHLQRGANLSLNSNKSQTQWIFDAAQLPSSQITVKAKRIELDGVYIDYAGAGTENIFVRKKNGEILKITNGTIKVVEINFDHFESVDDLDDYFEQQMAKGHLSRGFVAIDDFIPNGELESVGRAYYQVEKKRFFYTPEHQPSLKEARLAAVEGDKAWFEKDGQVWLVDLSSDTPRMIANYQVFEWKGNAEKPITRVWQENHHVYMSTEFSHTSHPVKLTYQLTSERMLLLDINGDTELLGRFTDTLAGVQAVKQAISHGYKALSTHLSGSLVQAEVGDLVSISGLVNNKKQRLWLAHFNRDDQSPATAVIKPNLPTKDGHIPDDLVLVLAQHLSSSKPVYFFYSHGELVSEEPLHEINTTKTLTSKLYRQEADKLAAELSLPVSSTGLKTVLVNHDQLIALANNGTLWQVNNTAKLTGVNEHWLNAHQQNAKQAIEILAASELNAMDQISLLGLKDQDNKAISLWYDLNGKRFVQAGNNLDGDPLSLIGLNQEKTMAWIYNQADKSLYQQKVTETEFSFDERLMMTSRVDDAQKDDRLEGKVSQTILQGNNVQLITTDGLVLVIPVNGDGKELPTLVAVTPQWVDRHGKGSDKALADAIELIEQTYTLAPQVVVMGDTPKWYVANEQNIVSVDNKLKDHDVRYLGRTQAQEKLFFDNSSKELSTQSEGSTANVTKLAQFELAAVEGQSQLILRGSAQDKSPTVPRLKEVYHLLWSGNVDGYQYQLNEALLRHYHLVVIKHREPNERLIVNSVDLADVFFQLTPGGLRLVLGDSHTLVSVEFDQTTASTVAMTLEFKNNRRIDLNDLVTKMNAKINQIPKIAIDEQVFSYFEL